MITPVNDFKNITTGTTTQVFTGPCILAGITVNTTAAGTITVEDGDTVTQIVVGIIKASIPEGTYYAIPDGIRFNYGIRIVTAAGSDITVVYRAA